MSDRLIPVKYRVADSSSRLRDLEMPVFIEERVQRDGSTKWAVADYGEVLNRDGEWEREPIPSSRDEDFIARTRFASPEAALAALDKRLALVSVLLREEG